MKSLLKGAIVIAVCGALNFGLTNDAQAADIDFATDLNGTEYQEIHGAPPGHRPPPPGYGHHEHRPHHPGYDHPGHRPPPPPDFWGDPPPPPRHGW